MIPKMAGSETKNNQIKGVLADALETALENLGVDSRRFQEAPYMSRRRALVEALYRLPKELLQEFDFFKDCSSLSVRKTEDFSEEQLRNHQQMMNLLIALVCLGECQYLKPLTIYLSFPEERWSIRILPLLEIFSGKKLGESVYRVPNEEEVSTWRIWAMDLPDIINNAYHFELCKTFLQNLGFSSHSEEVNTCYATSMFSSILHDVLIPIEHKVDKNNEKMDQIACQTIKTRLDEGNTSALIIFLNDFNQKQLTSFADRRRMAACINDFLVQNKYSDVLIENSLKQIYSFMHQESKNIDARTLTTLYLVFAEWNDPGINQQLATRFAFKLLENEKGYTDFEVSVLRDLISGSINNESVTRITEAYSKVHSYHDVFKRRLLEMEQDSFWMTIGWIANTMLRELEDVCLIGSEQLTHRGVLIGKFWGIYHENSQYLARLYSFRKNNQNQQRDKLFSLFGDLRNIRSDFQKSRIINKDFIDTPKFVQSYDDLLRSWSFDVPVEMKTEKKRLEKSKRKS
jgi:hypothetical protein